MEDLAKNITGNIIDIQRFSLNDGPGIRTTVFLKGCPLDCKWCHNPEAKSFKPQLYFNESKCENCLRCVEACPTNSHFEINAKHQVNFNSCNLSGECISVCPNDALKIIGDKFTIDEVMKIVLKDKEYYKNSGGGLTLSGGEPTAQFKFTLELLKAAKKNNIHTAVETCGFVSPEKLKQIAEFVDLFIFDYKETDVENHLDFTGESNELILQNLQLLDSLGSEILLRCPIIPGYNDRKDHFE